MSDIVNHDSSSPQSDPRPKRRQRAPLEQFCEKVTSPQTLLHRTVDTMSSSIKRTIDAEDYCPFFDDDLRDYRAERLARTQILIDAYAKQPGCEVVTVIKDMISDTLHRLEAEGEDVAEVLAAALIDYAEETMSDPIKQ